MILAIGQAVDASIFDCDKTRKNAIAYDKDTFMTSIPGVFAGGDCGNDKISIAVEAIADAVHGVLERTPPELAADIFERGIVMTGGGSLLYGLDKLIQQKTGIHAMVAEDAVSCVAIGTGRYIEFISETAEEEREQKRGFDISGLFKKK